MIAGPACSERIEEMTTGGIRLAKSKKKMDVNINDSVAMPHRIVLRYRTGQREIRLMFN
jgi:hypothetical protein